MRRWLCFILLALGVSTLSAQIRVSVECDRVNYLLYAPMVIHVSINNNTEQEILLQNSADTAWLSFIVTGADGFPIHPDQKFNPDPLLIKAGETKVISVNLTPYYAFREPGNFKTRAVVSIPGQDQIMSGNLQFNVNPGRSIWTKTRPIGGSERTYTLMRFSPDNTTTELYLRVDDLKQNIVYSTISLGPIISIVDPQTFFDKDGNLHVLHTIGQGTYHYSRINPDGVLENQGIYESLPELPPHLAQNNDGSVMVVGGQYQENENRREHLSDAVFGAKPGAAKK